MHAVLRIDLQTRLAVFLLHDFIHTSGAITRFRAGILIEVHRNRHFWVFQTQMGRLVFFMVGAAQKHAGQAVESQHAIGFRIVDFGAVGGFFQAASISTVVFQSPRCFAFEHISVQSRVHHSRPQTPFERWTDVAHAV